MYQPMKLTALVASALLLGLTGSAFAQSAGNSSRASGSAASTNAAAANHAGAVKASDSTFMKHAAADSMAEIAMGELALQKSSDQGFKQLAQRIISDHTKANQELKALAQSKQVALPSQPDAEARKTADAMRKMDGAAFDKAWAKHMVSDHQRAVAMFTKESKNGGADVRDFAAETLPALRTHLQMAQQLTKGH